MPRNKPVWSFMDDIFQTLITGIYLCDRLVCDYVNYEKHIRNAMTKDENVQLLLLFKMDWMNS